MTLTDVSALPADFVVSPEAVPARLEGGVVAIGNFDGVHRGHQAVLGEALADARAAGRPTVALAFEPHPRTFFRPEAPVYRITPPAEKAAVLAAFGLDGLVLARFDAAFAGQSADAFIDRVLTGALAAREIIVGHDFRFGHERQGDASLLEARGVARGFGVRVVEPFVGEFGAPVSSTRIRGALEAGDLDLANALLGYRHLAIGPVIHGEKRGRTLNYPTANQRLAPDCRLRHGIYAVRAKLAGAWHLGVASFGRRPTFDNGAPLLETYLFDFAGDLYGTTLQIAFVAFLRPELRFDSVDALVAQMDRDSADARHALAGLVPLSPLDRTLTFS